MGDRDQGPSRAAASVMQKSQWDKTSVEEEQSLSE